MRQVILHGHIFKNAGTTFDWSLKKNFGDGFLDHREDKLMRTEGRTHIAELVNSRPALRALSSHHMSRDLPSLPGVAFIQVYLLRHPVARLHSVYDFERTQKGTTPGSKAARSKTFTDYVAWRMLPDVARTIRNYQTLYLAGNHAATADSHIATIDFPEAMRTIQGDSLVGLVERYDESMVMLEEQLRPWFADIDLSYVVQNAGKSRKRGAASHDVVARTLEELGDLQQTVIDQNSFDLALYQLAGQRLQSRIDQIPGFERKLEAFRERCRRRRKLFSL